MRKYKWLYLYKQEARIGLARSYRLRTKDHLRIAHYKYFSRLTIVLKEDLDRCMDAHKYNHYSMKKGNEHHLTLIVESRVLKI